MRLKVRKLFLNRIVIITAVVVIGVAIAGVFTTRKFAEYAENIIIRESKLILHGVEGYISGSLDVVDETVTNMSGSPDLVDLLKERTPESVRKANALLDRYNRSFKASVCYVMDANGVVIASSNRTAPSSYVGNNYASRPYFMHAIAGDKGHYFSVGETTSRRGYYSSSPIKDGYGNVIGVAAIKKNLYLIGRELRNYRYCFFVNRDSIIFMASDSDFLYKSISPIPPHVAQEVIESQQFGPGPFEPIWQKRISEREYVKLGKEEFIISRQPFGERGWSLVLLFPTTRIKLYKSVPILTTFFSILLIIIFSALLYRTYHENIMLLERDEKIRENSKFLENVIESLTHPFYVIDAKDYKIRLANSAAKNVFTGCGETCFALAHNREEPCAGDHPCPLDEVIKTHKPVIIERVHKNKKGEKRIEEVHGYPIFDEEGNVTQMIEYIQDITLRRKTQEELRQKKEELEISLAELEQSMHELKQAEAALVQSEKLASLGKLVADMAHEVNNPLMIISGRAQLSLMDELDDPEVKENLEIIKDQCDRAKDIIQRLLLFSKPSKGSVSETNINEVLEFVIKLVGHQYALANINITKDLDESIPPISVDAKQMHEVFFNLIKNAAEAMPEGGDINISTSKKKDKIRIDVADNGSGMSKKTINNIFDPFFTTKEKGTGLGLSVCYGIVRAHKGELSYSSEVGKGTTATIVLPIKA